MNYLKIILKEPLVHFLLIGAERTNIAGNPDQTKVLEACRAMMGAGYATLPARE